MSQAGNESDQDDRFDAIVRKYLGVVGTTSVANREEAYERAKTALNSIFSSRLQSAEHIEALMKLDIAIYNIERGYMSSTWLDMRLAPVREIASRIKIKYGFIPALITGLIDFLKPILDWTRPIFLSSGAIALMLLLAARFSRTLRTKLHSGALVSVIFCLLSGGWLTLQSIIPGANDAGVIASYVPGAGKVQNAILAALSRIEQQQKRTAEGVERLEPVVRGGKRETSEDPEKELINLGVVGASSRSNAWRESLRDGNVRLIRLLAASPAKADLTNRQYLMMLAEERNASNLARNDIRSALREARSVMQQALCETPNYSDVLIISKVRKNIGPTEFKYYCQSRKEIFQKLLNEIDGDWMRLKDNLENKLSFLGLLKCPRKTIDDCLDWSYRLIEADTDPELIAAVRLRGLQASGYRFTNLQTYWGYLNDYTLARNQLRQILAEL